VEVGDVALIQGLSSEQGVKMNGRHGKVVGWNASSSRFAVLVKGKTMAIRACNLQAALKKEEMTEQDETLFLSMTPTSPEVQVLPWMERMRALGRI